MKIDTLAVGPIMTNCYLLQDEKSKVCAVIDPGEDGDRIATAVKNSGCALRYVLLTHGHYDHFGGLEALMRHYPDVPVYIHPNDAGDLKHGGFALKFPRMDEAHQRWYGEGDTLQLGELTIRVMETPGHTSGSVCLLVEDAILAGDTLFYGSCGRTDLPSGDYREILCSLGRLGKLEGNYRVYPGHDRATDLEQERKMNPYLRQGMTLV